MFVNISNHPSVKWSPAQIAAAGEPIIDVQFPAVSPELDENKLLDFVCNWADEVLYPILPPRDFGGDCKLVRPVTAHLMGETGFCALLAEKLRNMGAVIVHSTTAREVVEHPDGSKTAQFRFVRFRRTGF